MCHHSNRHNQCVRTPSRGHYQRCGPEDMSAAARTLKLMLGFVTATVTFEGHVSLTESWPRVSFPHHCVEIREKNLLISLSRGERAPSACPLNLKAGGLTSDFSIQWSRDKEETDRGRVSKHGLPHLGSTAGLTDSQAPVGLQQVSACQRGDQTGAHLKEIHGVWSLTGGEQRGASGQRPRERGAEVRRIDGRAGWVDAESGSVEAGCGPWPLRRGGARFKSHRFDDVICMSRGAALNIMRRQKHPA